MLRLLICILSGFAIAAVVLLLRQQRAQLRHESAVLHAEIVAAQRTLWRQQLQVAADTAPAALARAAERVPSGPPADEPDGDAWAVLTDDAGGW